MSEPLTREQELELQRNNLIKENERLKERDTERSAILLALKDCRDDPHHAIGMAGKVIGEKLFIIADLRAQLASVEEVRDEYHHQWLEATESEDRLRAQLAAREDAANQREVFFANVMNDAERMRVLDRDKLAAMTKERDAILYEWNEIYPRLKAELNASEARVQALEGRVKAFETALEYCGYAPHDLAPSNQAQYLVARRALIVAKENPLNVDTART